MEPYNDARFWVSLSSESKKLDAVTWVNTQTFQHVTNEGYVIRVQTTVFSSTEADGSNAVAVAEALTFIPNQE